MADVLTWQEIESRFPDEWVLIIDPDTGPDLKVRSGVVAYHSKDRDKVHDKAMELRPRRSAILFLGDPFPSDTIAIL